MGKQEHKQAAYSLVDLLLYPPQRIKLSGTAVLRKSSIPDLLSIAKAIFYLCEFTQLWRHSALQAQTSPLQLNKLAEFKQKILLENCFIWEMICLA